jgi:iron(III) transport system substrate-binding protein
MKKYARLLAQSAVVALAAWPNLANAQDADLIAKAKAEGSVTYYGIGPAGLIKQLSEAFTKQYGIKVETFITGGVQIAQKVQLEITAGKVNADVVEIGDSSIITELARKGSIASYVPPDAKNLPKDVVSADGYWVGFARNTYPIIYNKKLVSEADSPKSYKDLTDPKWKDKVVVASPNYGSSQLVFVKGLVEIGGWELVEGLKKNNLFVVQGWPEAEQAIATGERSVGVDINVRLAAALSKGEPFGVNYPTEGTIVGVSVIGILKDAPHPNAARLFEIFRLSQEQQKLLPKVGMYPVIADAGAPAGMEPLEKLKQHPVNADELSTEASAIKGKWTNLVER